MGITISTTFQLLKSELKRKNYSRDNIPDVMMWQQNQNDGQIKIYQSMTFIMLEE